MTPASGVRTILVNCRLSDFWRQTMQVRWGICFSVLSFFAHYSVTSSSCSSDLMYASATTDLNIVLKYQNSSFELFPFGTARLRLRFRFTTTSPISSSKTSCLPLPRRGFSSFSSSRSSARVGRAMTMAVFSSFLFRFRFFFNFELMAVTSHQSPISYLFRFFILFFNQSGSTSVSTTASSTFCGTGSSTATTTSASVSRDLLPYLPLQRPPASA